MHPLSDKARRELEAFAARDPDEVREELIAEMRRENPEVTAAEIEVRLGVVEAMGLI